MSSALEIEREGCFPFGLCQADHRGFWIKIKINNTFGYAFQSSQPLVERRVKCVNQALGKKFQDICVQFIH